MNKTFMTVTSWHRRIGRRRRALMAAVTLGLMGVQMPAADAPAAKELHEFTNASGATIQAEILTVVGDEVSLQRDDGKKVQSKISVFSKDDQAYIQQWLYKSVTAHGGNAFAIQAVTTEGVATPSVKDEKQLHYRYWTVNYEITLKNQIAAAWGPLQVRYIIIKDTANHDRLPPKDFTESRLYGTVAVEKLAANEKKALSLEKMDMKETTLVGSVWANGAPSVVADKLLGIWVRVYDADDNLLQEFASAPDIIQSAGWTYPKPAAKGAGKTPRAARSAKPTKPASTAN